MSALSVNPPFPIFLDIDGQPLDAGASTTLYVDESDTGNTGWVAK